MAEGQTLTGKLVRKGSRLVVDTGKRKYRVVEPVDLEPSIKVDFEQSVTDDERIALNVRPADSAPRIRKVAVDKFMNPYTFVPATARTESGRLGDSAPDGHDRLLPDRWTGRIAITITTETPLLLSGQGKESKNGKDGHRIYSVPERAGRPYLPPTSVKGMLRSAYEAVTNSRFGVFDAWPHRLGYRMAAKDGLALVPARVSDDGATLVLLPGTTAVENQAGGRPQHAAWLPRYGQRSPRIPDRPEHGRRVAVLAQLMQHRRRDKKSQAWVPDFRFWWVIGVGAPGTTPKPTWQPDPSDKYEVIAKPPRQFDGWACITNQNINRKHDERIFLDVADHAVPPVPLTDDLRALWRDVVLGYRRAHTDAEIWERPHKGRKARPDEYTGDQIGDTAWSRHLYTEGAEELRPGDLLYARVERGRITGLFPVIIARELYEKAPAELLDRSLRPAATLDQLSPADRVFGWTNGDGNGAHRGQLRIGPVICESTSADAVERFGADGLPLAILGQPKPTQALFYVGNRDGSPLEPTTMLRQSYSNGKALRGRKAYPHHAGLPNDYWTAERRSTADKTGRYQEYRRQGDERDRQNRSIEGWVRPGVRFRTVLEVRNLSDHELGHLQWLLRLPAGHFHRLGLGKPLGFGSVRLEIDETGTDLRRGKAWRERWTSLGPDTDTDAGSDLDAALTTMAAAVDEESAQVKAFRTVATGVDGVAVHYPRPAKEPSGKSYEWFVDNQKGQRRRPLPEPGGTLPHNVNP